MAETSIGCWFKGLATRGAPSVFLAGGLAGLTACSSKPHDASSPGPGGSDKAATNAVTASAEHLYQPCLLCHSTKEMQRGPVLNGLPAWYVEDQIKKFRDGVRGSNSENRAAVLMAEATPRSLASEDISMLARHISSLPVPPHLKSVNGDVESGRRLYFMCAPCHGDRGQGNTAVKGPPLDVQEDWYLLDQLRKFKAGLRGDHPEDIEGQAMAGVMSALDDRHLRDVVAYIVSEL